MCPRSDRYESVIATLCENLDSLDEPEARAAMIWIVGEYAERIDNADELLESFLEGFHDESTQVQGWAVWMRGWWSCWCPRAATAARSWMQSILCEMPPQHLPFLKAGRGQLLTCAGTGSAFWNWKSPGLSPSCFRLPFSWGWWYHPPAVQNFLAPAVPNPIPAPSAEHSCSSFVCLTGAHRSSCSC